MLLNSWFIIDCFEGISVSCQSVLNWNSQCRRAIFDGRSHDQSISLKVLSFLLTYPNQGDFQVWIFYALVNIHHMRVQKATFIVRGLNLVIFFSIDVFSAGSTNGCFIQSLIIILFLTESVALHFILVSSDYWHSDDHYWCPYLEFPVLLLIMQEPLTFQIWNH